MADRNFKFHYPRAGRGSSVVSVVYYTRVVMLMYMREPNGAPPILRLAPTTMAVLAITAVGILYMGIFPGGACVSPNMRWRSCSRQTCELENVALGRLLHGV